MCGTFLRKTVKRTVRNCHVHLCKIINTFLDETHLAPSFRKDVLFSIEKARII